MNRPAKLSKNGSVRSDSAALDLTHDPEKLQGLRVRSCVKGTRIARKSRRSGQLTNPGRRRTVGSVRDKGSLPSFGRRRPCGAAAALAPGILDDADPLDPPGVGVQHVELEA